jgi:anthranilate/para-aminobenzoate synthase component I
MVISCQCTADGLDELAAGVSFVPPARGGPDALPFRGGWIGGLSYEIGRRIEPSASSESPPTDDRKWPLITGSICSAALIYDHHDEQWYAIGEIDPPQPSTLPCDLADAQPLTSSTSPRDHVANVQAAIDLIGAGDIFQANITRKLTTTIHGHPRTLGIDALRIAQPWYGAYIESRDARGVDHIIASLSPELFLEVDGDRQIITRPMKGTRPSSVDPDVLRRSQKDAAELHMIVDLMRNDLGRLCVPGSVHVPAGRVIECHPTISHGVGEVRGTLALGAGPAEILRATFPPGSVTGAPKIRAMQIIDELERSPRGPYCGAVGMISSCGRMTLSVTIRTLAFQGTGTDAAWRGTMDYGTGGGIVWDSDPHDEYQESQDKAAILNNVLSACGQRVPETTTWIPSP